MERTAGFSCLCMHEFSRNLVNRVFFSVMIMYKLHFCIPLCSKFVYWPHDDEFSSVLAYSLGKLGMPNITPKTEQRLFIEAVYHGKDMFMWLPRKSWCFHMLPFVTD